MGNEINSKSSSVMSLLAEARQVRRVPGAGEMTKFDSDVNETISRLDAAFEVIVRDGNDNPNTSALKAQSLLYASYLTDVKKGKISIDDDAAAALLLIQDFCVLIESRANSKGASHAIT